MIILITGPSGSGKSTLGKKINEIFKNVKVQDTDDIGDETFKVLFDSNNEFKSNIINNTGEPWIIHKEQNKIMRDIIIQNAKENNVDLVFVGMTVNLDDIDHIGYFIDVDVDENYRRVNLRVIDEICNERKNLQKLLTKLTIKLNVRRAH